jgi:hypothetical protein
VILVEYQWDEGLKIPGFRQSLLYAGTLLLSSIVICSRVRARSSRSFSALPYHLAQIRAEGYKTLFKNSLCFAA